MAIDAIVGAVSGIGDLLGGAAAAAPEVAAAAAPEVAATAADVGGAIALPEITVTAADAATAAGAGTEAALAGGAAAGGLTGADAALDGAGLLTAGAAGLGGLGGGGAGTLTAPITAGVPSGTGAGAGAVSTGAPATPSDVLGGTQLASLGATDVPAVTGGPAGGGLGGASDIFAHAPAATPGEIPFSTAYGLMNPEVPGGPGTDVSLPWATASPTPIGTQIAPDNIPATAAPATYEGNVATEANPNVGGQFGSPAPLAGATGTAATGLGSALRTAGLLAPLGALGLTLARGQPGVSPATQTALNQTAPFSSYAQSQLAAAQANQLTPAMAASIATYKQNAQNQLYQLYAREGRDPTNDSDYIQGLQQIDQNALGMQQQFIQDMVNNAIAAQGVSDNVLQTAANEQVANDNAFQQALTSSVQSFGLVAAINTLGSKAA